jgi:hypothetical protein
MKFLLLLHEDSAAVAALTPAERRALVDEHISFWTMLNEGGRLVAGEALAGPESAAVVRPGQPPAVTDGPFTETKEAIGGFYLIECENRNEALEIAGQVPQSPGLAVEVLEVAQI